MSFGKAGKTMRLKRVIFTILGSVLLLSPALLTARQERESVADAARKAQAQKKTPAKPAKVFTNDNLDTITGTISVVGAEPAPPPAAEAAAPEDKSKVAPAGEQKAPVKDEAYWRAKFAEARKKLGDDVHELDIQQREYNLKQQQYYSDPNMAMREQYNRQDLIDSKSKIDDKTAAVAQDKQAIADLEDELRQAGGDPGWAAAP
jgi:hypothetical protein